jgi:RNA polymerase sigma factor (sigma-70 family)
MQNFLLGYIRRNKKMGHISSMDDEKSPQFADTNPELSDAAFLEMNVNKLAAAMEKIPTDDKTLLIMKYKDGVSIKELAEITNKTESAIKMKLKRAKDKVREHYDKILLLVLLIASGFRGQ